MWVVCYSLAILTIRVVRVEGVHSGAGICSFSRIARGNLSSQLLALCSTATLRVHSSRFARLIACHPEAAS